MPGPSSGQPALRLRNTILPKSRRLEAAGHFGTSNTPQILTGNTNEPKEHPMNATVAPISLEPRMEWTPPSKGVVGMTCLIIAESAIFTIFVVAYLYYLGKDLSGPTPRQILELPILNSICLLSSSATISFALRSLRGGNTKRFSFWWLLTIVLGAYFLLGTAREWHRLIYEKGFTIKTNLFGTT